MSAIDDYLETVQQPQKDVLQHVREVIKQTAPDAVEVITYGMPGFKYNGKYLISFSAFKDHMSIFPGAEPFDSLAERLAPFKRLKGTIQFTLEQPLPDDLLKDIVALCVARNSK
jgi:uncharacterized protein YdhG (YjbR/CyaY superfamily)